MRLKSEIWVKAYLRRCSGDATSAVVVRRGDADAGVIFIKVARLNGTADLYGPAHAGLDGTDLERRWICLASQRPEADIDDRLDRETKLDPDAWVLEVEQRDGRSYLDTWLSNEP